MKSSSYEKQIKEIRELLGVPDNHELMPHVRSLVTQWRATGEPAMTNRPSDHAYAQAFREVCGPNGGRIDNDHVVDFIETRAREIDAAAPEGALEPAQCIHSAVAPNMNCCIKCGQVWTDEGWANPPAAAPEGAQTDYYTVDEGSAGWTIFWPDRPGYFYGFGYGEEAELRTKSVCRAMNKEREHWLAAPPLPENTQAVAFRCLIPLGNAYVQTRWLDISEAIPPDAKKIEYAYIARKE